MASAPGETVTQPDVSSAPSPAPEPRQSRRAVNNWGWVRPFLVRVLINSITLLALLALFQLIRLPTRNDAGRLVLDEPILQISHAGLFDVLLLGLALAVVGVLVRPVLTALSGALVVRTYGLTIVVINVIIVWLAFELVTLIAPVVIAVPSPRVFWLLVVAMLFSLVLLLVNTLLGLNRPRLGDVDDDQPIWRLLDGLPHHAAAAGPHLRQGRPDGLQQGGCLAGGLARRDDQAPK